MQLEEAFPFSRATFSGINSTLLSSVASVRCFCPECRGATPLTFVHVCASLIASPRHVPAPLCARSSHHFKTPSLNPLTCQSIRTWVTLSHWVCLSCVLMTLLLLLPEVSCPRSRFTAADHQHRLLMSRLGDISQVTSRDKISCNHSDVCKTKVML